MHVETNIPDSAGAIEALAEGFILLDMLMIVKGLVPAFPHDADVVYKLEAPGEEDWKLAHRVLRDGWGDCEDLVFWTVAGLRVTGEDPDAKLVVIRTGQNKLHAVVERGDGSIEDPSLDLIQAGRYAKR